MVGPQSLVRRAETTVGPVAFGGRTITLAARSTAAQLGDRERARWGVAHVRARPAHIEVLHEDGQRQVIRVRDVERTLVTTIAVAGVVGAYALRVIRNRRSVQ